MSEFAGKRVLVIGLARAGTGMAKALIKAGAIVTIVDQKSADSPSLFDGIDELGGQDAEIVTSWTGTLDGMEVDIVAPSPGVPRNHPALMQSVKRNIPVLSEIEIAFLISRAPIIAITGTNGKSTVTALTYHLLSNAGKGAILCGNIAGSGYKETTITSAADSATPDDVLVAEVSSFQLEWVERFRPKAATITNITADHLDRYDSFDDYKATKQQIYAQMGTGDLIVANQSFPDTLPQIDNGATIATVGREAIIRSGSIEFGDVRVEKSALWVPAEHSLANLGHAVLLCGAFGLHPNDVLPHVASFRGLDNRLEMVGEKDGIRIVNNSMCTNPSAVLSSLDGVTGRVLLLAGGVSKVADLHPFAEVGRRVAVALLFGRDAHLLQTPIESGGGQTSLYDSLDDAFSAATSVAREGDTILLSPGCASFDQFEDFMDRGNHFRRLAKQWIGT